LLADLVRMPLQLTMVWSNLPGLLAIALVTGVIAGSYPAFYLSSLRPLAVLGARRPGRTIASHFRTAMVRKVLVVVQFSVSIIFLVAIVVIIQQLGYLRTMDLGYDRDHLAVVNLPNPLAQKTEIVKTELLQHSTISAASVSRMTVTSWSSSFGIDWQGKPADRVFDVGYNAVDYDFLETFGLEMKAGRFFAREFFTDRRGACVVNQALVQAMGVTDPVGMEITISPDTSFESKVTIIGVIRDFNTESAHSRVRPFLMRLTTTGNYLWLRVSGHNLSQTMRFIRTTVKELAPDSHVSCRLLNDDLGSLYTIERLTGLVIALITSLAVFISCLGLLGLTAFTAEQRTKEIGIRKVLGAEVRDILQLLMREVVILVAIAGVIACPIAYLVMSRWLETFAYRTTVSLQVLFAATIAVLVLALLTVLRQARRAAVANPIDAIRYE